MKYKIKKFQGGGFATFTPISLSAPVQPMQPESVNSDKQSEERSPSSLLDKELYKELINKGGLVNDVNLFVDRLQKLESEQNPYLEGNTRSAAIKMISEINTLKQMKEVWNNTIQTAEKHGGLNEVAVGNFGELYAKDSSGKIKTITTQEYIKHGDKYNVLTVADLMNARQFDPSLAYNDKLFVVGENAIGMNNIVSTIKELISSLGTETSKEENYYSKKNLEREIAAKFGTRPPTPQEKKSMEELYSKLTSTPGEFFKVTQETKSERNKIELAFDYIWNSIGRGAQLKLKATAALQGESDPKKIIKEMLVSNTDISTSTEITPQSQEDIEGSGSSKGLQSLTNYQMYHKDKLSDTSSQFIFNDPKLGVLFKGYVGASGPLLTENDEVIPMTTLDTVVTKLGYSRIVDSSKIFFGNKKVNPEERNNIIFDGETTQKVYMPVDSEGKPDYEEFKHFKEIYSLYEANKNIWSARDAEKYFNKEGYNIKIDDINGDKIIRDNSQVKPFLVMYGYTNDATSLIDGNDQDIIRKLSSKEEDLIVPRLESVWTIGTGKNKINYTPEKPGWDFGEDYYKGIITIPYRKEHAAIVDAISGKGPKDKVSTIGDVQWNLREMNNAGAANAHILNR